MRVLLVIVVIFIGSNVRSQAFLDWSDLTGGISFQALTPDNPIPGFSKAEFSHKLAALEGKEVVLTGYFLVLDGTQSMYMLSMNPMASCFFCGNGGPETVVGLQFLEKQSFRMDELLSVRGTLHLNRNDPNEYYYRIEATDAFSLH